MKKWLEQKPWEKRHSGGAEISWEGDRELTRQQSGKKLGEVRGLSWEMAETVGPG